LSLVTPRGEDVGGKKGALSCERAQGRVNWPESLVGLMVFLGCNYNCSGR
jgi:hypothetical protein